MQILLGKKRLILVCGLGGVGKTTLAAALGLKGARAGKRCLVITVDPARRLAQALGLQIPCPEPKKVWEAPEGGGSLYACLLDAKHTFDQLIRRFASKEARETIFQNPLYQQLSLMLAGTQEYMAMEKLYALSREKKFDLLIVDTPPSRQSIDFLKAPVKLMNLLHDSILRVMVTPSLKIGELGSKMLSFLGRITGGEILEDIARLMQMTFELLGGFSQRAGEIQQHLTGPETAFILATAATTPTLNDGIHFREEMGKLGFFVEGVLVNRMPPSYGSGEEIQQALRWGRKQEDPLWRRGTHLLGNHLRLKKNLEKKLRPLVANVPHYAFVPEMQDGVEDFGDLEELSRRF